jgi:phosphoglycolate phosphatase-like HAD superfamily hydrolase
MKVVLFDIDGTLVDSGGAGGRAFSRALQDVYGFEDPLANVRLDGMTDQAIVRTVFSTHGIPFRSGGLPQKLAMRYIHCLKQELRWGRDRFRVLPGVKPLLNELRHDPRFLLGLASGNVAPAARLKLDHGGLSPYFITGGFGSDSECRTEIVKAAVRRALELSPGGDLERVFVIGDTSRDILHGRRAGATTIAVASGSYSLDRLQQHKPDLAVESLNPVEPVLAFLGANPE